MRPNSGLFSTLVSCRDNALVIPPYLQCTVAAAVLLRLPEAYLGAEVRKTKLSKQAWRNRDQNSNPSILFSEHRS